MRLASHLKKTRSETRRGISSMEFMKWNVFLDEQETEGFNRSDYYLAQIALYVAKAAMGKSGANLTLKQFLLKFGKEAPKPKVTTREAVKQKMLVSRGAWSTVLGIKIPVDDLTEPSDEDQDILPFPGKSNGGRTRT